jgi:hypothetical protein
VVGLALAALILIAALVPATSGAATGSISGTAIDAVGKEGVEGVEVCAWSLPEEEFSGCAETDSIGSYAIEELEPGEYGVDFWSGGLSYRYQVYDGRSNWFEADPVLVGSSATTGIDAELVPAAAIEGTVTAIENGLPVEEVEVCAYEAAGEEIAGCAYTAADGTYSIGPLEGGDYKIEFWPAPSGQILAFQFYDHEDRWSEADVLTVAEGETKAGVDADLAPGARIAGRVSSAASGLPLEEIRVCSIDAFGGGLLTCSWTNSNGDYLMRHLTAGVYKVVFSIDLGEWFGVEGFDEDDGFPTEFWNDQTTLASAYSIPLASGGIVQGIDAQLGGPEVAVPPVAVPPAVAPAPSVATPRIKRPRKCRRGFRKKLVRGKRRCVRIHRRRPGRHRRGPTR